MSQRFSLFKEQLPAEIPVSEQILVGLEIIAVHASLNGVIRSLDCQDPNGEIHTIEFKHGVIVVDGDTVLVTNQELREAKNG